MIFGGANSLDNFFAREDGSVDWLMWSDEGFYKMSKQIDLELIECRQFKNGCVYVLYKVKN